MNTVLKDVNPYYPGEEKVAVEHDDSKPQEIIWEAAKRLNLSPIEVKRKLYDHLMIDRVDHVRHLLNCILIGVNMKNYTDDSLNRCHETIIKNAPYASDYPEIAQILERFRDARKD